MTDLYMYRPDVCDGECPGDCENCNAYEIYASELSPEEREKFEESLV